MLERATQPVKKESDAPKMRQQLALLPWLLIALGPPMFALATWRDASPADQIEQAVRLMGLPLCLIELTFLLFAVRAGWRPVRQIIILSLKARSFLLALIALAFLSATLAPNPQGSLVWTYLSFLQLLFGFATMWMVANSDSGIRDMIWPLIALGCLLYAVMAAVFAASPHRPDFDWQYFGLAVANVRQIGFYMLVGTLAAIGCAVDAGRTKTIWVVVACLMMTLSFWTGSRGAAIAAVGAIVAGIIAIPHLRSIRTAGLALLPIPAGAVLSIPLPRPISVFGVARMVDSLQASTPDRISGFRLRMWKEAWNAFLERPWIGYGEGQFGVVAPQPQAVYLHPHNVLLQFLVQWGVIGTAIIAILAFSAGAQIQRTLKLEPSERIIPAFLVCVGLVIFSSYDGAMFHTYPVMMFTFALAFLLAGPSKLRVIDPGGNHTTITSTLPTHQED